MRLSLDRSQLLGFEARADLTAKVGSKTVIVGVPSASHSNLATTAPSSAPLTFPVKTA